MKISEAKEMSFEGWKALKKELKEETKINPKSVQVHILRCSLNVYHIFVHHDNLSQWSVAKIKKV